MAILRTTIKWLLFPGINLHSRQRYQVLPGFFSVAKGQKKSRVLDAGSGNGMLSYKSYLNGNEVVGVSFSQTEVEKSQLLFNQHLRIAESQLRFECGNLYELDYPDASFDEIICSEVLEHLMDDAAVCRSFWRLLKPGGILHVCAPNAEHPYNASFPLDKNETGGHVRPGYTMASYQQLLEPIGFSITESTGLGGPIRQAFSRRIKETQARFGAVAGLPWFVISLPFVLFERKKKTQACPFSIYVQAVKEVS